MARLVPTNLGWHQHTVPCFFSLGGSARPEKLRCGFSECGHARGRVLYVVLARTSDRASVRFFLLTRARQKFLDEPTHFSGDPEKKQGSFPFGELPCFGAISKTTKARTPTLGSVRVTLCGFFWNPRPQPAQEFQLHHASGVYSRQPRVCRRVRCLGLRHLPVRR